MSEQLRPLVKWIGGKRKLAKQIVERMPAVVEGTYFEPFAGAAAVFCELWNAGRIKSGVVLADHNRDLVALYGQVRDEPQTLLTSLRAYEDEYRSGDAKQTEALYYRVRGEWNAGQKTPARFVFLKQTAFNGLWRVNQKGELNAAWGKYGHRAAHGIDKELNPCILDEPNIMAWHEALRRVALFRGDTLAWRMPRPVRGDVVYLDPPYVGTFDGYTSDGFTDEQQDRLLTMASEWTDAGVVVAYSNSGEAEERVRRLWPDANVEFFSTSYTVNRDPEGRKGKRELFAVSRKEAPVSETPVVAAPAPVAPTPAAAPEFDIAISPSQVETFDLCARKWAYQKIDRIPSPQNAAAALGEAAHKHRENWLIHGIPPPVQQRVSGVEGDAYGYDKAAKLALVGLEHLPPPGKAQVEIPLLLPVTLDADPSVNGGKPVRVKVNGRIDFFVPNTPESGFVFGEAGIPLIGDHKTTSGEQWAKTADDLLTKDSQAAIYAAYALHVVPTAPAVDLHWSYMVKGSSPRQHQVRVRMSRDQAMTRFSSVVSRAKSMLRVIQTPGIVASRVEPTVSACEAFGGCPYREVCPISNQEKVGALMAQGSLNDLLTARLANPAAAPAPAPTNHNVLAGLTAAAPPPANTPVSNPSAMAALFGTPAPATPAPALVIPAPTPALVTAPPAGGSLAGLFGALGTPAPAPAVPAAPVAAPAAPAAPPASNAGALSLLLGGAPAAPAAPAPAPVAPTPAPALVIMAPAPTPAAPVVPAAPVIVAAPAVGVVPPDAPASDPSLTLEDVKAIEAGAKKQRKAKKVEAAPAPAAAVNDEAMVAVLTRIAVALEALAAKGS